MISPRLYLFVLFFGLILCTMNTIQCSDSNQEYTVEIKEDTAWIVHQIPSHGLVKVYSLEIHLPTGDHTLYFNADHLCGPIILHSSDSSHYQLEKAKLIGVFKNSLEKQKSD